LNTSHLFLADIIVQNMEDIDAVGDAFSAVFAKDGGEMGVAMTAVITGFIDSDMLVEIEADAVVD
jgi:enamine deaminase RidA (YjgF/YER057c/UK114 family)